MTGPTQAPVDPSQRDRSTVSAEPGPDPTVRRVEALIEALPWVERYAGQTIVVKYGGNAMIDDDLKRAFADDVVFLRRCGIKVVVVHGGGPQITDMMNRLSLPFEFKAGRRVTTAESIDIIRMVLVGQVGRELVNLINAHGPLAVGMSGEDAGLLLARPATVEVDGQDVDLGLVGEVAEVRPAAIWDLIEAGRIPIVAGVAADGQGTVYNINADTAAAALAMELRANRLVMLTDVEGLYLDWPHSTAIVPKIAAAQVEALLPGLTAGMRPKMEACLDAVRGGVHRATVTDGRVAHAVLLELFTNTGIGTMVTP
ncbi:MAG: acetylglutamate kinase [Propionibacteriaceae bacterium]|jgi:acetylglutamate kinase|nr:acetylglutamate kinase [Propionibacteriaceae bacterium]